MFKNISRAAILFFRNSLIYRNYCEQNPTKLYTNTNHILLQSTKMATSINHKSSSSHIQGYKEKYTNRLAQEHSPYLLQHAHNPVDWYPWCDEAIQRAKDENKLIFLSVGYSTCHWCHVMEKESFENEDIARIMNANFINIKVDREERPDIDKIYMTFVLMINGSGGWPMSVWLTPDLAPISAGTYFPPTDRWGMSGFSTVLNKIVNKWEKNSKDLTNTSDRVIKSIEKSFLKKSDTLIDSETTEAKLDSAVRIYKRNFDEEHGGLGNHPKFPEVSRLNLLFHAYFVKKDPEILKIVLKTLEKIGNGGIHDHIFGGFARYSVDRQWHVPHFEKMLYDQGQLMSAYAKAYKITNDKFYLDVASGIFKYVTKDLLHPAGGFYSGEDADSYPTNSDTNKVEGAFYAWDWSEIKKEICNNPAKFKLDTDKVFEIFCHHYNIQEKGNINPASDPHGHLTAKNVLIVKENIQETCLTFKIEESELKEILNVTKEVLYNVRSQRPRPHLDTKIITAWNGLLLSGLSELANCESENKQYLEIAKNLVDFLKKNSFDNNKKCLLRSLYGATTTSQLVEVSSDPIFGFLDDYAFLIKGLLDYYRATLDLSALEWARELQDIQNAQFWDDNHGGYYYSQKNALNVVVRLKEDHDGAEPCGNSVSANNLLLLSCYYDEPSYKEQAEKLFNYFSDSNPLGYVLPELMTALISHERGLEFTAVVGHTNESTDEFMKIIRKYYIPGLVLVHFDPEKKSDIKKNSQNKFKMIGNKTAVYMCHNKVCQLPIVDPQKLEDDFNTNFIAYKT